MADNLTAGKRYTAKKLIGADARESLLLAELPGPSILHISTHSFYCGEFEGNSGNLFAEALVRSGIALSGANRGMDRFSDMDFDQREDGILTALEILALDLDGVELVVLSSCESGVGTVMGSEGAIGLKYAIGAAGAEASIVSLWSVPDLQTATFMDSFYRAWVAGERKSEAHRRACKELIDEARKSYGHSHPNLWAGFVMTGIGN